MIAWPFRFAAALTLSLLASVAGAAEIKRSCPQARLEYRVYLKAGAEYVDVQNPRVEDGHLVYQQYGGEVRQAADNLVRIEPLSPETTEALTRAAAWERARLDARVVTEKDQWFQARGRYAGYKAEDWLEAVYAAREYVKACGAAASVPR